MKLASSLVLPVFLAAHAAVLALPVRVELAGSILFAAAFLAIAVADYTRRPALRPHAVGAGRTEPHRLAA